jgi:peptide/nickel transport system permease protein
MQVDVQRRGEGPPPAPDTRRPARAGESFWEVAGAAFRRRAANLVACGWIGLIAFVAVVVPFVANGQPYTIEMKGDGGWSRHWPLFATLTRLDVVLVLLALAAVLYGVLYRLRVRRIEARDERLERGALWLLAVAAAAGGAAWGVVQAAAAPAVAAGLRGLASAFRGIHLGPVAGWAGGAGDAIAAHPRAGMWVALAAVMAVLALGWAALALRRRSHRNASSLHFFTGPRLGIGCGLLLAGALLGARLDPGVRLSPYDYRAYEGMLTEGTARGAVFAPIHWGYAEQEPLIANRTFEFPTREHWLGTDGIGRDALSRLLWSMRVVMGISFVAEAIALTIGVAVGAVMGYFRGRTDLLGMRLVEIFESIPTFILILIFVASYGRDIFMIMVILGLTGWTGIARFVRAEFLSLRDRDFVQAARALGLPVRRVLFRHMLPNGLTPVIVTLTFGVAGATMSESGLSFLGVGVEPPTPSWGSMLNEAGNPAETFRWWLAIAPGLMIFMTVYAYNIIGEGLQEAIDPRTNKVA